MSKNIMVLGELHQDLYYETDYYDQLVKTLVDGFLTFTRYNPDDMNRKLCEKIVKNAINEMPKKIEGNCFFKRGGNANNSSEFLAKLGVPTKLMSIIGRGSEWMYPELKQLGILSDTVFQIDEITPVSTIIKSVFTTKIFLAPNLKNKMNFDKITVVNTVFDDSKIIFSTPIAEKFVKLFEQASSKGLITAFNIETQKVKTLEEMSKLISQKYDLFFLNVKDAHMIMKKQSKIEQIDTIFKKFANIRVYTASKEGSYIYSDNFKLFFPGIDVKDIIDRTGAGDCYAAGFLTKLYELVEDKTALTELLKKENTEKLKPILNSCGEYATYSAIYKITKQAPPTRSDLEEFIKFFKIKK